MAAETEDQALLDAVRLVVGLSVRAADQVGEASLVQLRALTVLSESPDEASSQAIRAVLLGEPAPPLRTGAPRLFDPGAR